jgi:CHAT domain-containing protein/tetratricopeptide (TPR) repeat protein
MRFIYACLMLGGLALGLTSSSFSQDGKSGDSKPKQQADEKTLDAMIARLHQELRPSSAELRQQVTTWEGQFGSGEWTVLKPSLVESVEGATLAVLDDKSILVAGTRPDKDTYHVELRTDRPHVGAIRIEALPHDSLPNSSSGRGKDGGFVLTEVGVSAGARRLPTPQGRFLRVQGRGEQVLNGAEVQVFSRGSNIAMAGTLSASSEAPKSLPEYLIDGVLRLGFGTAKQRDPWWEIDLGKTAPVDHISVWGHYFSRDWRRGLNGARLILYDADREPVWETTIDSFDRRTITRNTNGLLPVKLSRATATFEDAALTDSPYRSASAHSTIDDDDHGTAAGWSVGSHGVERHSVAFTTDDIAGDDGCVLSVDLQQHHGQGQLLGRFRISVAETILPVLPPRVAAAIAVRAAERSATDWAVLEDHVYENGRLADDLRPDAAWMMERLADRMQMRVLASDFDDAVRWAREAMLLEQRRGGSALEVLEAAMQVAQLCEAVGMSQSFAPELQQLTDLARKQHGADEWLVEFAQETLGTWARLSDDQKSLDRLAVAAKQYLTTQMGILHAERASVASKFPGLATDAAEAVSSRRVLVGEETYATGLALYVAGVRFLIQKQYDEAIPVLQSAVEILGSVAPKCPKTGRTHEALARCYSMRNAHEPALASLQATLRTYESIFPENDPRIARARSSLARLAPSANEYSLAVEQSALAVESLRKHETTHRSELAEALAVRGSLLISVGDADGASKLLDEARQLYVSLGQSESQQMASVMRSLGTAYSWDRNRSFDAQRDWEEALRIAELNEDDPLIAHICVSMAMQYDSHGESVLARPLLERAVRIHQRLGETDAGAAFCLRNWGAFLARTGTTKVDSLEAEKVLVQALEVYREEFGPKHPVVGVCLGQLGEVRAALGKLKRAKSDLERAIEITRKEVGEKSPNYVWQSVALAEVLTELGEVEPAEKILTPLLDLVKEVTDDKSFELQRVTAALGVLSLKSGDLSGAAKNLRLALETRLRQSAVIVRSLPEAEALAYQQETLAFFEQWYAAVAMRRETLEADSVYELVWEARGLVARELARRRAISLSHVELSKPQQKLARIRRRLSDLYGNGDVGGWSAAWRNAIGELTQEAVALEKEIAAQPNRQFQGRHKRPGPLDGIGPSELVRLEAFPADAALVEFVRYRRIVDTGQGRMKQVPHYDAFVLRPDDSPTGFSTQWVELGRADELDELIDRWRIAVAPDGLIRGLRRIGPAAAAPDAKLRQSLWQPVEKHLKGCETIVLIPTGALWRLPWGALPSNQRSRFLIEDFSLTTISHGSLLYDVLTRDKTKNEQNLFVGGIDFGKPSRIADDHRRNWRKLESSEREIDAILPMYKAGLAHKLSGVDATEFRLRELMPNSRIVHIATHGILADELMREAQQPGAELIAHRGFAMQGKRGTISGRHPMLLSWIMLANANQPAAVDATGVPTGPDGLLTAEEVIDTDLSGVELVVLSSCETGLGNIIGGEGVFGLQRAFQVAGCRSAVASLWPVRDSDAAAVMTRFHRNLVSGEMGKLEALRKAQLAMLRGELGKPGRRPIQAWAGWSLSGDWR